ncbi:MAG: imidazolonepropionase, partial [Myxococcota bacterium]
RRAHPRHALIPGGRDVLVVRNIRVLCTMEATPTDPLGRVENAALIADDHDVTWVGPEKDLPPIPPGAQQLDARGGAVLPGLVECHTHLVYAGDRAAEYVRRARGETYLQIAQSGGGIMTTVRATRAAPEAELVDAALFRLRTLLRHGVTTCEVKSGYGLTIDDELKLLRAVRVVAALQPVELVATFLGAHTCPPEYQGRADEYLRVVCEEMVPAVAEGGLARFCDIFVEKSAFSPHHARTLAEAARKHGLGIKLHVDQLSEGNGAQLAAELGATSADHLDHTTPEGIAALKNAGVTAVLLPTAQVFLGHAQKAPGRALIDAGVPVAISTDLNPGTSPCAHLPLAGTLAVSQYRMTVEESLLAITRNAARAVGRPELGRLVPGSPLDAIILDRPSPEHLLYEMAGDVVGTVIKSGRVVHRRAEA